MSNMLLYKMEIDLLMVKSGKVKEKYQAFKL